jgi:Cof subfamily protein (haloacid dehalogenase superfamily)
VTRGTRDEAAAAAVRLIATDLDGTLLRSDGKVSERTRRALDAAARAQIAVVLVTGRPPRRVRAITAELGLDALVICSNGALIYDPVRELAVEQTRLPGEAASAIVTLLRERFPELMFAVEVGMRFGQEPTYARTNPPHQDVVAPLRAEATELCKEGVTKLIARHPTLGHAELFAVACELIGARATVTHSGANFLEIAAPEVNKAFALARLCAQRGIAAAEVVAFGDMPNDLPMLQWAGHGVAVANAHPELLAASHEVTASNDEDGVARVLERLLGVAPLP